MWLLTQMKINQDLVNPKGFINYFANNHIFQQKVALRNSSLEQRPMLHFSKMGFPQNGILAAVGMQPCGF